MTARSSSSASSACSSSSTSRASACARRGELDQLLLLVGAEVDAGRRSRSRAAASRGPAARAARRPSPGGARRSRCTFSTSRGIGRIVLVRRARLDRAGRGTSGRGAPRARRKRSPPSTRCASARRAAAAGPRRPTRACRRRARRRSRFVEHDAELLVALDALADQLLVARLEDVQRHPLGRHQHERQRKESQPSHVPSVRLWMARHAPVTVPGTGMLARPCATVEGADRPSAPVTVPGRSAARPGWRESRGEPGATRRLRIGR